MLGLELWSSKADETVGGQGWIHVRAVVDSGPGSSVGPLNLAGKISENNRKEAVQVNASRVRVEIRSRTRARWS